METTVSTARMTPEIARFNVLLGRELGYTPFGDPIYKFEWSEDLFWPLYKTGQKVADKNTYEVPIIGAGRTELVDETKLVPEYTKARMTFKYRDQWIATAWLPPEGLQAWVAQGAVENGVDRAALAQWAGNYEGADYPHQGFRVCTNYVIPKGDVPNIDDIARLCAGVRDIRSYNEVSLGQKFQDDYDKANPLPPSTPEEYNRHTEIGAAIGDAMNAWMNPTPGKRGGSVSVGGVGENPVARKKGKEPLIVVAN